MERTESPDKIYGMDADDFAVGKKLGENAQRNAVVGIMESRHQDEAVGDIEVGVAGRKALPAKYDGAWQRQLDNCELPAVTAAGGFEAGKVVGEGFVVGVFGIRLNGGDDGGRRNEARDVVDVPVGVVTGYPATEPDDLLDAEIVVKCLLELLAAYAGVALLYFAEQTLFGSQQDAFSIGVDGTAFEDEPALLARRVQWWAATREGAAIRLRVRGFGRRGASRDTWPRH